MGLMHPVQRAGHRTGSPWPRRMRRQWARPDDLVSVAWVFATIPSLPRAELARLTTRMIDHMDEIDGDPDLECGGDDEDTLDQENALD